MKKKRPSVRTNISVPADLKCRMEKVEDDVNWSALACRAFEAELGQPAWLSAELPRRCYPIIREWSGTAVFYILDENMTQEVFEKLLKTAGQFIGLGRFRPAVNGPYGRFEVESIDWQKTA